ncbi:MAG: hypothetical protein AAFQ53_05180, partial [Bacteroidota bacterium]
GPNICLEAGPGGPVHRLLSTIQLSGASGSVSSTVNMSPFPGASGAPAYLGLTGQRIYVQTWHRDVVTGIAVQRASEAVGVRIWG